MRFQTRPVYNYHLAGQRYKVFSPRKSVEACVNLAIHECFMTEVKCPTCGKETRFEGNEFRPFCSERCKLLDFGAWADEEYSLPAENAELGEDELAEIENVSEGKQR